MTTDIERELRELFRDKAGEAPVSTLGTSGAAPQHVLRRGRRRQVGTVLGSALVAIVLAVGSFAGLRSLLRSDTDPFETGSDYEVFERTATIEAFTVTSPSDWFLVNEWPLSMQMAVESSGSSGECTASSADAEPVCITNDESSQQLEPLPYGLPMIQLSNTDTGLSSIACRDGLPSGAAVLYVALDYGRAIEGIADPSAGPWPGSSTEEGGPCGPGSYARFTVNGEPFFSWIGFGDEVSEDDRSTLLAAYGSVTVDDGWEPVPPDTATPAYVIAGGSSDNGDPWRLELRPGERSPRLSLEGVDPSFVGMDPRIDHDPAAIPIEICCGWTGGTGDTVLVDVTFGFVRKDANGVELQVVEDDELTGQILPGTVVPIPPSLGSFGSDLFFIPGTAGLAGQVVPLGIDGSAEPSVATDRADEVRLSGALLGQNWTARFTGAFADDTACIYVRFDEPFEPLCPGLVDTSLAGEWPSLHGTLGTRLFLLAGSVPTEVAHIRFTSDDGTSPPTELQCAEGPRGWTDPDKKVCAIALPPEGAGTFQYLDTSGAVLFEDGNGWGSGEATTDEYPWANEGNTLTARGSFMGANWRLQVLHYRNGYRLTVDGRQVFEGTLPQGPVAFPLFQGDRSRSDAIVLLVDGGHFADHVAITSESTWYGRWLPGATADGGEARIWVFELPGAGTGRLLMDEVDRGEISWP